MSRARAWPLAAAIAGAATAFMLAPYWLAAGLDLWQASVGLLLLALHAVVFVWCRQVYGSGAAVAATAVLAIAVTAFRDAGLVFPDAAGTVFFATAAFLLSRLALDPTPQLLGVAAVACGATALTPLGPIGVLCLALAMVVARAASPSPREPWLRAVHGAATAGSLAAALGIALAYLVVSAAPRVADALVCATDMPSGVLFTPLLMLLPLLVLRPWRVVRRYVDLSCLAALGVLVFAATQADEMARRFATFAAWPIVAALVAAHFDSHAGDVRRSIVAGVLLVAMIANLGWLG